MGVGGWVCGCVWGGGTASGARPSPASKATGSHAVDYSGGRSDGDGVPYNYADDGVCDDGGPGAKYSACAFGALRASSNLCPPTLTFCAGSQPSAVTLACAPLRTPTSLEAHSHSTAEAEALCHPMP